jgi:hypothetical protein
MADILHSRGQLRLQVRGSSMLPGLWPGDELTIRRAALEELQPNDLAMFTRNGHLTVHRVIDRGQEAAGNFLLTRGDSLPVLDAPVWPEEVLGKVVSVHRAGQRWQPRHQTLLNQALSFVLRRSHRMRAVAVRLHALGTSALALLAEP